MQRILILLIVAASLLAGTFYMGYKQGAGNVVTVTNTVKGDTQVVFKDRIVTVTKVVQKDGTVTVEHKPYAWGKLAIDQQADLMRAIRAGTSVKFAYLRDGDQPTETVEVVEDDDSDEEVAA